MLALLLLPLLWAGSLQQHQDYQLQVPQSVTVQEGLCVLVPCAFSYPWSSWYNTAPLHTFWFWARDDVRVDDPVATNNPNRAVKPGTKNRFSLVGNAWENNCSLHIRDARIRDTGSYFFRVERGWDVRYSYKDNWLNLQVTALTQKPIIHISEALESGRPTRLSCSLPGSCQGGRPLTFSWSGSVLKSVDPETLQSPVLTLTPRPQDHGTNLTCEVKLGRYAVTTERTTIRLNVSYAPRNLSISLFFGNGTAQIAVPLASSSRPSPIPVCLALPLLHGPHTSSPVPIDFGWHSVGKSQQDNERPRDVEAAGPRLHREHNCSSSVRMLEGQSLQLRCDVDSSPPARLRWARGSPDLNASRSYSTGVLELPRVGPADEGSFACHADNAWGSQNASLSLSVFHAPQLPGPSCSWEAEGLRCSCSSHAQPVPSLRWWLGDRLLEGNSSNASFRVTSSSAGSWVNSSLSLPEGLSPGLRLSCEAQNDHGTQSATVLLLPDRGQASTVLSKEVFLGVGITVLLFLIFGLILVKTLRTTRTQAETPKPKFSRSSTILDYVNVIPKARNRKATPSSPSQTSSPRIHTPEPKKNQNVASLDCTEPLSSTGAPNSEISSEDLHYATVNFSALRPWKTQKPQDAHVDYAEIRFY
ncbi:sialic acid-binding Ig-like lectin 14 [Ctenodactylus gundi]